MYIRRGFSRNEFVKHSAAADRADDGRGNTIFDTTNARRLNTCNE